MFTCLSSALTEDLWGQEPHPMILGFLDPGHKHILKDAGEAVRLPALSTHHPLSFWVESRKFLVTAPPHYPQLLPAHPSVVPRFLALVAVTALRLPAPKHVPVGTLISSYWATPWVGAPSPQTAGIFPASLHPPFSRFCVFSRVRIRASVCWSVHDPHTI